MDRSLNAAAIIAAALSRRVRQEPARSAPVRWVQRGRRRGRRPWRRSGRSRSGCGGSSRGAAGAGVLSAAFGPVGALAGGVAPAGGLRVPERRRRRCGPWARRRRRGPAPSERLRIIRKRIQVGDDVGALGRRASGRQSSSWYRAPRPSARQELVEFRDRPLALHRLHGGRIIESRHRGMLATNHTPKIGTDRSDHPC